MPSQSLETSFVTYLGAHTDLDGHACEIIRSAEIGAPKWNSLTWIARHSHAYEFVVEAGRGALLDDEARVFGGSHLGLAAWLGGVLERGPSSVPDQGRCISAAKKSCASRPAVLHVAAR